MKIFIPINQKQKETLKRVTYSDHIDNRRKGILINSRSLNTVQMLLNTRFDIKLVSKGFSVATPKPKLSDSQNKKNFTDYILSYCKLHEVKLTRQFLNDEYEGLLKLPRVDSVYVEDRVLHVKTKPLIIKHPKSKKNHCIGIWDIRIDYNYQRLGGLRLYKIPKGYGLHTSTSGTSCYGNAGPFLDNLFWKMRTRALVMVAIKFLTSLNQYENDHIKLSRYKVVK